MATHTIEIDETFEIPLHRVFALFADHQSFGRLLGAPVKRIRDSDQADPNGIGSVRRVGIGPISVEETVTSFEPDSLIEYTITSLSPLKNHFGRIRFSSPSEQKTRVHYTVYFEDAIPLTGALVRSALNQALRRGMRRLPTMAK
ncbi:SRPBCC family protein [Marinobacter confluentis]|uniref:SRPBCC family protein n=1 Tax=Marinobacter confluentis TaxID=1697557 RepID=A0A4Z1CIV7_9GAMM|nr:SRPBCC family protein [Marinobacter confluentis]TGN41132.1 SRPBCC family protein [Marinobacter confluentis]